MASRQKEQEKQQAAPKAAIDKPVQVQQKPKAAAIDPQLDREQKKTLQRHQRQLEKTEQLIDTLKTKRTSIELEMSSPETYAAASKFNELEKSYAEVKKQLETAEKEYESIFEQILALEEGQ